MVYRPVTGSRPPEHIARISDPDAGLDGVIVIHSTRLGPAAGGCRLWYYDDDAAMIGDATRLAEGMSYKNAMADLPLGGGKAVLRRPPGPFDRDKLFHAFGRAVRKLDGAYITAEDVGTTVADMANVASISPYVAGLAAGDGRPGGDPSPWTALGVLRAMEVGARERFGKPLSGFTVAVQGLGAVGYGLCELLHTRGARLVVADIRDEAVQRAVQTFGATAASVAAIAASDTDIYAPCALGRALDAATASQLKARLVCGAANNQLVSPEIGDTLRRRNILYCPDFVVNAGGIINVAGEYLGWSQSEVSQRVEAIAPRLAGLLRHAAAIGVSPAMVADQRARERIAATRETLPPARDRVSA